MKKLLSILLVSIMLLTPLAMTAGAQTLKDSLIESTPTENKITSELSTYLEGIDNDEYVKIYVWLNDYGEDMLYQVLSKRLGATITAETEENYIVSKISAKKQFLKEGLERLSKSGEYNTLSTIGKIEAKSLSADDFRAQALIPEVMTDTEIQTCLESQMTSDEIISLSERTQFLKDYRATRKALNTSVNDTFYQKLNLNKCKNVYLDQALAYAELECPKSYVENLESMDIVNQIGLYTTAFATTNSIERNSSTTHSSSESNYEMTPHQTLGYDGTGVKIGVVEATIGNSALYDTTNPHLSAKTNSEKIYSNYDYCGVVQGSRTVSQHATGVLSILCGDPVTVNGKTYQGIAPNATIYYYPLVSIDTVVPNEDYSNTALYGVLNELVCDDDVSVINMSWNSNSYAYYRIDAFIDRFIVQYRVSIISSAGNSIKDSLTGNVIRALQSPAWAYNSIAVGNIKNSVSENDMYFVNESSMFSSAGQYSFAEYERPGYAFTIFANKPDISAHGTNVVMVGNDGQPSNKFAVDSAEETVTGTSCSAPMVAGTVALMIQANSDLIDKPDTVKALLLGSADENAIYYDDTEGEEDNEIVSSSTFNVPNPQKIGNPKSILREKSGAGLLNIPASIRSAISGIYFDCIGGDHTTDKIYIAANTTIKFGVVYEKYTDEVLDSAYSHQTDIQIIDSSESVVFKSTDTINNVEMFICTIKQGGVYKFRIDSTVGAGVTSQMNSTIVLMCDCTNKNLVKAGCSGSAHSISCDCGFEILETHNWTPTVVINLSNGATFFTDIEYLYKRGNTANGEFMCFIENTYFSNPSGTNMTLQGLGPVENYSIEYTSTGKIVRYSYSLIIEENGQYSFITTRQVTFVYDYFAKTITAY